jgi:hypothetical protein
MLLNQFLTKNMLNMLIYIYFRLLKSKEWANVIILTLSIALTWCITVSLLYFFFFGLFDHSTSYCALTLLEQSFVTRYTEALFNYMFGLTNVETPQIYATYKIYLQDERLFSLMCRSIVLAAYKSKLHEPPVKYFLVTDNMPTTYTPQLFIQPIQGFTNCYFFVFG